jgi:CBS domain-containing protein
VLGPRYERTRAVVSWQTGRPGRILAVGRDRRPDLQSRVPSCCHRVAAAGLPGTAPRELTESPPAGAGRRMVRSGVLALSAAHYGKITVRRNPRTLELTCGPVDQRINMKSEDERNAAAPLPEKPKPDDHFVDLMFSGMSDASRVPVPPAQQVSAEPFHPLRQSQARPGAGYGLRRQGLPAPVRPDSPAVEVMTDLKTVAAVTIRGPETTDEANRTMRACGVRALFVIDDDGVVLGIITSTDVLGESPIRFAQQRGIRHDEVTVRDVMTPAGNLDAVEFDDVLHARVGDVVATLRRSGRQHALVVEREASGATGPTHTIRGIFSLTQIARQLGLPPQSAHDIGSTFAKIEAVMGS